MRGAVLWKRFTYIPGTQIVALCDYEKERAEKCQKYLKEASLPKAAVYSGDKGYEELCKRDDIDLGLYCNRLVASFSGSKMRIGKR